jgi:hypothetical protein
MNGPGAPVAFGRRALLAGTAALVAGTATGCWPGDETATPNPSAPPPTRAQEAAIFDLSFVHASRYRPFALLADGYASVKPEDVGPLDLADESPVAPFCAVETDLASPDRKVLIGLATEDGDRVLATYDPAGGRVAIEVRAGGRTTVVRRRAVALPDSFTLGFALCENQVTVLADTGDGWQPLLTERDKVRALVDLRVPDTLSRHRYAWGLRGAAGGRGLDQVRHGLFGMTGLRDQHLVQHADGTPYVRDGKAFFTATCAGLGFFQQAHLGVFTLDLATPERLEQVAQLYSTRDGLLLGDHAGQVVRDGDRWIVAVSSWGDFDPERGVHVRHVVTDADVLSGVHVLETERTVLPTEVSSWDPGITRIDGRWHVSFVESPSQDPFDFHPALAAGPTGASRWDQELSLIGAATELHQCEGPILAQVQGEWWFLASDGDARHYPVFDLAVRRVGRLDAPYETNIPHPQLVPREDGSWLVVTFDGTQYAEDVMGYGGHGDVLVLRERDPA